jgi:uncharacterized membrane protein YgcG
MTAWRGAMARRTTHGARRAASVLAFACLLPALAVPSAAAPGGLRLPERPGTGALLFDYAGVLGTDGAARVVAAQRQSQAATEVPTVVVTIGSRWEYGGGEMSPDAFAAAWYREWGIGARTQAEAPRARGALLLVAVDDRTLAVETGPGWSAAWRSEARRRALAAMLPSLQLGRYPEAALAGVAALRQVAREQRTGPPVPTASGLALGTRPLMLFGANGVPWPGALQLLGAAAGLLGLLWAWIRWKRRPLRLLIWSAALLALALAPWLALALWPLSVPYWRGRRRWPGEEPSQTTVRPLPDVAEGACFSRW